MPRRPSQHRVKRNRIYTVAEAAEAAQVHRKTVARWIQHEGLPADRSLRPWLIRGGEFKDWLVVRRSAAKTSLRPGEIFCLPCRRAVQPAGGFVDYVPRTDAGGLLRGICPGCDRLVHRVVARDGIGPAAGDLEVALA